MSKSKKATTGSRIAARFMRFDKRRVAYGPGHATKIARAIDAAIKMAVKDGRTSEAVWWSGELTAKGHKALADYFFVKSYRRRNPRSRP